MRIPPGGTDPKPFNAIVSGEVAALLAKRRLALFGPTLVGTNEMKNLTLSNGGTVTLAGLQLNSELEELTLATERLCARGFLTRRVSVRRQCRLVSPKDIDHLEGRNPGLPSL
jgi:hypothetical protein